MLRAFPNGERLNPIFFSQVDAFYSSFLTEVWPSLVTMAAAKAFLSPWLVSVHDQWETCLPSRWGHEVPGCRVLVAGGEESEKWGRKGFSSPTQSPMSVESPGYFKPFNQLSSSGTHTKQCLRVCFVCAVSFCTQHKASDDLHFTEEGSGPRKANPPVQVIQQFDQGHSWSQA